MGRARARANPWAASTTSFTWRLEDFSTLRTRDSVFSECFEAGIATWRLRVYPNGWSKGNAGTGLFLAVFLEAQDGMWEPSFELKITLLNQADPSKLRSVDRATAGPGDFQVGSVTGSDRLIELYSAAAGGWLVNDTLVVTVDVTVEREDRFQIDTGRVPCDATMKLRGGAEIPVHGHLLQLASPFFCDGLEDVQGGALIPVDGSLGTWTYILRDLYPQYDAPALTPGSAYTLLPIVHKYDFTKLVSRLVSFIKEKNELSPDPGQRSSFVICWLALAERLQLDELRDLCLGRLRSMTKQQLEQAILLLASGNGGERGVTEEVEQLGAKMCQKLITIVMMK